MPKKKIDLAIKNLSVRDKKNGTNSRTHIVIKIEIIT